MVEFMTVMSVAHEVVSEDPTKITPNLDEDEVEPSPEKLVYQGPSPDEVTLVEFARERGYSFIMSNDSVAKLCVSQESPIATTNEMQNASAAALTVFGHLSQTEDAMEFDQSNSNIRHRKNDSVDNNNLRFMIERRMEFTSTRKRMSILVLDPRDHRYKLYVKGADSEIQKRLKAEG